MKRKPAERPQWLRSLILREGILAAPLAAFSDSLEAAAVLCIGFLTICALTIVITGVIPRKVPFSLRILLYSVTGALVYIPTALAVSTFFPENAGGLYLPLLCSSLLVTAEHDRFYPRGKILKSVWTDLLGTWSVVLLFGGARELLGFGTILHKTVMEHPPLPFLSEPAGGLVLLACLCIAAESVFRNREGVAANAGSC